MQLMKKWNEQHEQPDRRGQNSRNLNRRKRNAVGTGASTGRAFRAAQELNARRRNEQSGELAAESFESSFSSSLSSEGNSLLLEGRNAVTEALRAGRSIDKLLVLEDAHDNALGSILREAKRHPETKLEFVQKERLDALSETRKHQGVIAFAAAYDYADIETILEKAREKGEPPFIFLLDGIEDPHNLGAIIRTANLCGAHGVIIRANRAVGLTATVAKASAGALNYTPVAKAANINTVIEQLKKEGLWFVCADMDGEEMYDLNLTGPIGLVIGNEGKGVSQLVKKNCDMTAAIPMRGDIDSLNASVAAGVLAYEILRQRLKSK